MKKHFFKVMGLLLCCAGSAFAQGGATTVGDGGHVVVCRTGDGWSKGRLLDLFEVEAVGPDTIFDLGGDRTTLLDKVQIGLARLQPRLGLEAEDIRHMTLAAKKFMRFQYDPWKDSYTFKAKDPVVRHAVYREFEKYNCYLDTVVIHPDPEDQDFQRKTYENLCMANGKDIRHCFLVNTRYLRTMDQNEKACLTIHEVLRFLPEGKKIRREADLRRNTYYACTGR